MKVVTGKVVNGKIVVEGASLKDGATVTVITQEGHETFERTADQEARLLEAIDEANRGDVG